MQFTQIGIVGLFGSATYYVPLNTSPVFLVGPNGSGKTTILKAVFFACTGQWDRLSSLPLSGIEFVGSETSVLVEKTDFPQFGRIARMQRGRVRKPGSTTRGTWPKTWSAFQKHLTVQRTISRYTQVTMDRLEPEYELLASVHNFIEENTRDRFLYFPTYRRVERDLKELIGEQDDETFEDEPDGTLAKQIELRFERYGEVIGFGGQDIAELISETAEEIRQKARVALNEHSIGFLDALVTADITKTRHFRDFLIIGDNADVLLRKIEAFAPESLNVEAVRMEVLRLVNKLRGQPWGRLRQKEDMLLYYLGEMHSLIKTIDELANPILRLAGLINKYIKSQKTAKMSETNEIAIADNDTGRVVTFDELSSGEKQILGFFAFLILNRSEKTLFVILDEPELSLSVSWQKSLIGDMLGTGRCAALLSATHSPFIVENYSFDNIITLGEDESTSPKISFPIAKESSRPIFSSYRDGGTKDTQAMRLLRMRTISPSINMLYRGLPMFAF